MAKSSNDVSLEVPQGSGRSRLDKFLRDQYPEWGRSAVGRLIQNRQVKVNGRTVWLASWKVTSGDRITVSEPPAEKSINFTRFDPKWLVADEGDLLVVNKPAGLRSQAARAGDQDNLLSLVQEAIQEQFHLFHRLDRDTSGLCLLTRPGPVNAYLDDLFKQRKVKKEYFALVSDRGKLAEQGELRNYLTQDKDRADKMRIVQKGGKFAYTEYWLNETRPEGILLRLYPHTGRTHQLRVQLAGQNAPIIGDRLYSGAAAKRLMLHAARIVLPEQGDFLAREWSSSIPF